MGHAWEGREEAEVPATVEQVWDAIATGPGIDAWFMGRTQVEPGVDGSVRTDMGGFGMNSTVTAWEPHKRFAYRGDEDDQGRFIAYEFLVEGRDHGSAVVRLVASGFLPGDDWEAEYDAMTKGGQMFFATLVAYLEHFAGRTATPIAVSGPPINDWPTAWGLLHTRLDLPAEPSRGDAARIRIDGRTIGAVVDFRNPHALGLRSADALYRFVRGFHGAMMTGHHLYGHDVDQTRETSAWQTWLTQLHA